MKIKEVCRLTGLSEKAIRYYIECGLISPSEYEVRGRIYRDYDENDVSELRDIISLRHLGFSIESISEIKNDGEKIPSVMSEYIRNLSCEVEKKQKILLSLSCEDFSQMKSIDELMPSVKKGLVHEIAQPNFSGIDGETASFEFVCAKREQFFKKGERQSRFVTAILVLGSLFAVFSKVGIVMFVLTALLLLGRRSDNISFYTIQFMVGATANVITFFIMLFNDRKLDYIYTMYLFNIKITTGTFGLFLYAVVIALQIISMAMLMLCKPLREYINKTK